MASDQVSPFRRVKHISDARGRRVRCLDPVALYLLRRHDVIEADALEAIANEKGVKISTGERAALIVGILAALLVASLFTHALVTGDILDARTAKTAGLLYACSLPWIIWGGIKRKRVGHTAAAMRKHQRCLHCGYNLYRLPPDPADGATCCPECGCAWQLGAVTD